MTAPTLTYGDGHLEDFIDLWNWDYESVATSDGNVGKTTTVDTARTEANDAWNGYYIKYLSGLNAGEYKLVTDFDQGTTTFTHEAFSNQTLDGDRYVISKYKETLSGMAAADATPALDPEDVLKITGICDSGGAAEEYAYYEYDLPTNLDTTVYTKCLVRHKVSNANAACKIVLVFTAGTQTIDLGHSTTWKVTSTTVTTAKTLDKIRVYFQHDLGDDDGTYYCLYDFVKFCKGTFTFPHLSQNGTSGGLFPTFRSGDILQRVSGRGGEITNDLGMNLPEITLRGDLLQGESWGTPFGQYFFDILRNDMWSWFSSDLVCCKVRITSFEPAQDVSSGAPITYTLGLRMYMASDILDSVWDGVDGWLGIES